jgi:hypothetical protein
LRTADREASMAEVNALREQIKDLQGRLDDLRGYL